MKIASGSLGQPPNVEKWRVTRLRATGMGKMRRQTTGVLSGWHHEIKQPLATACVA